MSPRRRPSQLELERLIADHDHLVRSVCRRYLRSPDDVDDAVQETFMKLLCRGEAIDGSVRGWLTSVAHTTSIDLIRNAVSQRNRRSEQLLSTAATGAGEPASLAMYAVHE